MAANLNRNHYRPNNDDFFCYGYHPGEPYHSGLFVGESGRLQLTTLRRGGIAAKELSLVEGFEEWRANGENL